MERQCRKCKEKKELTTEFYPRNKNDKDGFDTMCKACWSARGKAKTAAKKNSTAGKVIAEAKAPRGRGGWNEPGGVDSKAPHGLKKTPVVEILPQGAPIQKVKNFANLPGDGVKLFGASGTYKEAVAQYVEKYGEEPMCVYIPTQFFFTIPDIREEE